MKRMLRNLNEMSEFAAEIAGKIRLGQILALDGDLGSGKTTFTKALAEALGVKNVVTSPTFNIMKKYDFGGNGGKLVHIDCYRFSDEKDAISIGLEEHLLDRNNICVIEWPGRISKIIPGERTVNIKFKYIDETTREAEYNVA
jgi:tRNA threonylcarbamoyladenosine biosynthesis protein TsaE